MVHKLAQVGAQKAFPVDFKQAGPPEAKGKQESGGLTQEEQAMLVLLLIKAAKNSSSEQKEPGGPQQALFNPRPEGLTGAEPKNKLQEVT